MPNAARILLFCVILAGVCASVPASAQSTSGAGAAGASSGGSGGAGAGAGSGSAAGTGASAGAGAGAAAGAGTGASGGTAGGSSGSAAGTGASAGAGAGAAAGAGTGASAGTAGASSGSAGASAGTSGGDGPGGGGNFGGGNGLAPNAPTDGQQAIGDAVKAISRETEHALASCGERDIRCVADLLDRYASRLRQIAPGLQPRLRGLPDIVAAAARRARAARSAPEAARILRAAIVEVHKTIALIRADDAIVAKAETREGNFVAETLTVAQIKLEKATGI